MSLKSRRTVLVRHLLRDLDFADLLHLKKHNSISTFLTVSVQTFDKQGIHDLAHRHFMDVKRKYALFIPSTSVVSVPTNNNRDNVQ